MITGTPTKTATIAYSTAVMATFPNNYTIPKIARCGETNLTERRDRRPLSAALRGTAQSISVSPLGPNDTGNNESRHKHDDNDG
jgi:hypothetical protein